MRNRKTSKRICVQCNREHACHPGSESVATGAFCSKECRAQNKIQRVGVECSQCSGLFIKSKAASKFCSLECARKSSQVRPDVNCGWCGVAFRDVKGSGAISCSNDCRYGKISFTRWMRDRQRKYKASIKPSVAKNSSWERWCECTAMQKHEWKPLTLEQQWKRKCSNMAGANRYRVPNIRQSSVKLKKPKTWSQSCKTMSVKAQTKCRGKTLEQRWKHKLHNKASNHRQRLRRKSEMKTLQATGYSMQ